MGVRLVLFVSFSSVEGKKGEGGGGEGKGGA